MKKYRFGQEVQTVKADYYVTVMWHVGMRTMWAEMCRRFSCHEKTGKTKEEVFVSDEGHTGGRSERIMKCLTAEYGESKKKTNVTEGTREREMGRTYNDTWICRQRRESKGQ